MPANIAWLAFAYSLLTWSGMAVFGSETWIKHGEVFAIFFAIFFGLFARFAPTEPRIHKQSGAHGLGLRPFGAGLLANVPGSPSMVAFVLLVPSSVLYDGLLTTPEWAEAEQQLINLMPGLGEPGSVVVRITGDRRRGRHYRGVRPGRCSPARWPIFGTPGPRPASCRTA